MRFIFEIKDIIKKYSNVTAVDNVSFAIKEGEFFSMSLITRVRPLQCQIILQL